MKNGRQFVYCTGQNEVSADQYYVTISRAQVDHWSSPVSKIGSRTQTRLTYCNHVWIVRKPVNANVNAQDNVSCSLRGQTI